MNSLDKILLAKDKRAFYKRQNSDKGFSSLSLSLNIPGETKSNNLYNKFFRQILKELKVFLLANRIYISNDNVDIVDSAGNFFLAKITTVTKNIIDIKKECERFEKSHIIGRLIDVDIASDTNKAVSSGELKKCFLCNKPALICMREKTHSYIEIMSYIDTEIKKYLDSVEIDTLSKKLSSFATKSLLHELSLTPKPGLVDKYSSGSHKDMDYELFLNSISVINVYFSDLAKAGINCRNTKLALSKIREIGISMEEAMFKETKHINTQKGIIFLFGVAIFSSANTIYNKKIFDINFFVEFVKKITKNIENELQSQNRNDLTHGEVCFKDNNKYTGARGEVASGFATIFKHSLPVLKDNNNNNNWKFALQKTLLKLISVNNDTNIIFRQNIEVLDRLKELATTTFNSSKKSINKDDYKKLVDYCLRKNISPGGSADLLGITIYFYLLSSEL